MVGTLKLSGRMYGLVQTKDGLVHRVTAGNYMGQADGKITDITPSKISSDRNRSGRPRRVHGAARGARSERIGRTVAGSLTNETSSPELRSWPPPRGSRSQAFSGRSRASRRRAADGAEAAGHRRAAAARAAVQLTMHLSGPAPQPLSFTIDNPARISFDLPNTALALPSRRIDVHPSGSIRSSPRKPRTARAWC